ncbi:MAG TPA: cytidylate kinase family protein [Terriglobales bacterium]|nr:cytidylate kinase family protein [Terriglobales bacterium]
MALLLISRGSFSGCDSIRRCLPEISGIRCLTREDLVAEVNTHGEIATKIVATMAKAAQDYGALSALRRPYKILMQRALLEYARQGDVAYFGYSGHLLLSGIAHIARVRIIAPVQQRVQVLMKREGVSAEAAEERIRQQDEERNRWTRFMYGKSLNDLSLYDTCINLERISYSTACCLLQNLALQREFKPTPESLAAVENAYLAACVLATLVDNPRTSELEMGATAKDGRVTLEGPYLSDEERAVVLDAAKAVPGVAEVCYTEGYAPAFDLTSV